MKITQYEETCNAYNNLPEFYKHFYPDARLLFFDIETTGFAAKDTTLYLIGALWYEEDHIRIIQWFNDDGDSENEILTAFNNFCKDFSHLVHFNGLGFDIPYLRQKADLLNVPLTADKELTQIDIYKEIRSYKKILALDNMKQVSIEGYLGIDRQDTYSGKELIHIYQKYAARPDNGLEQLLLLHNHDDLLGMPQISKILNYKAFFEKIEISSIETKIDENKCIFTFTYEKTADLPRRISLSHNGFYLNASGQKAVLFIPIICGTLKHYFKDYKNYYYLPKEDMAIHKSIALYVEPENRIKAAKDNCYIKKTEAFIPCLDKNFSEIFQTASSDKNIYQTLESVLSAGMEKQQEYIKNTLQTFI